MESLLHRQIHDKLLAAQRLLFIIDERIDGDSLGSALGMADYALHLGKEVVVYTSDPIPSQYRHFPHIDLCHSDPTVCQRKDFDLIMTFDCSDGEYVRRLLETHFHRPFLINIDHHVTNPNYGDLNQVVVVSPATAEVVYQFFKTNDIVPSKEAATALFCGIAFDTTMFTNEGTNARALDAAADLLMWGARVQAVFQMMFSSRSVAVLRVWGAALERLHEHPDYGFLITFLTRSDLSAPGITDEEIKGLTDFLNIVTRVETLCVLQETKEGGIKASMRSSAHDVAAIAQAFGGGGHRKAAGFRIPNAHIVRDATYGWRVEERKQMW